MTPEEAVRLPGTTINKDNRQTVIRCLTRGAKLWNLAAPDPLLLAELAIIVRRYTEAFGTEEVLGAVVRGIEMADGPIREVR